ncbi:MAG TPA: hypothetical protein VN577_14500 [Terriglobales bacterium]|nr:hypothetical protein [Terriglobales bacterium]
MATPDSDQQVIKNLTDVRQLLESIRTELDRHPKLEEAIVKLEMALENLTIKSGGML